MSISNSTASTPVDFRVENHGNTFIVRCETEPGKQALLQFVEPDVQWFGDALAVEPKSIGGLVSPLLVDGWRV